MNALRNILIWLYSPFKSDRGGDWPAIFFCILAAMIFWFFNSMNREHSAVISYPIKFDYNDSSLILVSPLPKKISLQVSGYGWNLLRKTFWFNIDPVTVKISNPLKTKIITTRTLLPLVNEKFKGIKIHDLLKDTIWINFERKIIKEQVVYVDTSKVSLAKGLMISSPVVVEPSKVLVEGPESLVDQLDDTLFLTIPNNSIEENFDDEVKIFQVSNLLKYDRKKVRVTFEVAEPPAPPPPVSNDSLQAETDSVKNSTEE